MKLIHYIIIDLIFCIGVYNILLIFFTMLNYIFTRILKDSEHSKHNVSDRVISGFSSLILFILILKEFYG